MESRGFLLLVAAFVLGISVRNTEASRDIKAHVGQSIDLPCRVDTTQCGELHSVKWYKDTSRIYVFSQVGDIARAEGPKDVTQRMIVDYTVSNNEVLLKITPVEVEDEANYKCEITYLEVRENCDVVQIIKLATLVAPETVRMLGNDGTRLENHTILGPMHEGTHVELICEANHGRPTPKVTWYNGTHEMKGVYTVVKEEGGLSTGRSKLEFELSRGDLSALFECRVESDALEQSIISSLSVDVNVKPLSLELSGVKSHVVEGTNVILMCDVFGARPAADVKWFNNSIAITETNKEEGIAESKLDTQVIQNNDGTYTTKSSLIFKASRWENGQSFMCYADNIVTRELKEPSLHGMLLIQVFYPPVINVSPPNITTNESSDILLLCYYIANPSKLEGVAWSRDDKNLTLYPEKYEGGTIENTPLIIKNVTRDDMGHYTCMCTNNVGSERSESSIFVNVLYPPDVKVNMEPSTPVKAQDAGNVTLICSVTSGNPSTLLRVRWYLDGEILKELPECNYTSYDENGIGEGYGGPLCLVDPSILSLEEVGENFAGNYTCQGMNVAGWGPESEPEELIVHYPPSPAKLRYTPSKVVKSASVTLECSVDHPGRPDKISYIWYKGTHQVLDMNSSIWTINPVNLQTKSNFTCIAVNEGGRSDPATVFIDVSAPPAFIQNLNPYEGILSTSKHINLTCRVECSPICSITWFKDNRLIDVNANPLYTAKTEILQPDLQKNDFESIKSTLIFNMSNWPGEQLDRTAPNSYYKCQSSANGIGPGVTSVIEIAVNFPPENLTVTKEVIDVKVNHQPDPVTCDGKGHPTLQYAWTRNGTSVSKERTLVLSKMNRNDGGYYVCEASNKHGSNNISVFFNVQYAPECGIVKTEVNGNPALICSAEANPSEVTFTWKIQGTNDTQIDPSTITQEGVRSILMLDSSIDTVRTYLCYANNTVDMGVPCEIDVAAHQEQSSQIGIPGNMVWWKRFDYDNWIIIIAAIIAIVICVIIICIIIILVCRRKRAQNKYNNPVEMEEREKPDGHSPDTSSSTSKWPFKQGVLLHVNNKMHGLNNGTIPMTATQFKTTSVAKAGHRFMNNKRNRNKVYARLEKLRDLLGFGDQDSMPFGVYRGSGGVTFKKISTTTQPEVASRKRKKPGLAPNPSSTVDKNNLGGARPGGGSADPLTELDKGFYENLPFHGMQNPPNKPISVISPIIQGTQQHDRQYYQTATKCYNPYNNQSQKIQRNQSFHGFQNMQNMLIMDRSYVPPQSVAASNSNFLNLSLQNLPQFYPNNSTFQSNLLLPSVLCRLPSNFNYFKGSKTVAAIRTNPQLNFPFQKVNSFTNMHNNILVPNPFYNNYNPFVHSNNNNNNNPFSSFPNSFGQPTNYNNSEYNLENLVDIRRSRSGINNPQSDNENGRIKKSININDKRFSSLELRKHKCYSPTFYSMRCKKHAKKRPVLYAIPKKINKHDTNKNTYDSSNDTYENLTDSIQIMEENAHNCKTEIDKGKSPKPAPRLQKSKKEIVYANVSDSIQNQSTLSDNSNTSSDSLINCQPEKSIIEAEIHNSSMKSSPDNQKNSNNPETSSTLNSPIISSNLIKSTNSSSSNKHFIPTSSTGGIKDSKTSLTKSYLNPLETNPSLHLKTSASISPKKRASVSPKKHSCTTPKVNDSLSKKSDIFPSLTSSSSETKSPSNSIISPLKNSDLNISGINKLSPNNIKNTPMLKVSPNFIKPKVESPKGALYMKLQEKLKSSSSSSSSTPLIKKNEPKLIEDTNNSIDNIQAVPKMPLLDPKNKWMNNNSNNSKSQNAFYTLTSPHFKQLTTGLPQQYSATLPHQKHHMKLIPRSLFQEQQIAKSKSFSTKSKQKKSFQIPLQKCHSFKFQTAESYFQPIKNIHEENLMRNGYISDLGPNYPDRRPQKSPKHNNKKGPLVLRRASDYHQDNINFQENIHNSVQLQYPQPVLGRNVHHNNKPNGLVYADLDMPKSNNRKKAQHDKDSSSSLQQQQQQQQQQKTQHKKKPKTEYATLKFNDIGQEIDV